jgi:hypothetical protein
MPQNENVAIKDGHINIISVRSAIGGDYWQEGDAGG